MRGVVFAFAGLCFGTLSSHAPHARASEQADPARALMFSGFDAWRNGGFVHGGLLWSPDGLDKEGFTFKALVGAGTYSYVSGALGGQRVVGRQWLAAAMPGWRFNPGWGEFSVFGGLDVQQHTLKPNDPGGGLRGLHYGARLGFDLWTEPLPGLMGQASASGSTIGTSYWTRVAVGFRALDSPWVGPEALALGDENYRQWRVGIHLTGLRNGAFEWSAGAGYARDSDDRDGAYVRFGVLTRR